MTGSLLPVHLALLALLLPAPAGLLVPVCALAAPPLRRAVGGLGLSGLLLLAASTALGLLPRAHPPRPPQVHAVRATGTWRHPPTEPAHLQLARGPLPVQLAADVRAPQPGTPVEALLRVDADGQPTVVSLRTLGPPAGAWLDRWALACASRVRQLVPRDDAGLLAALVLGQREDLSFPDRRAFALTGTSHVLAISGQQVTLVAGALGAACAGGAWLRPALLLCAFVAVAGAGAPLVRAALGWLLVVAAARLARPADSLHRLAGIALLMLCWQPALRDSLSAQLSFLAVAGLITGARLVRGPATLLLGPLGAFLATAPLCVEVFGVAQPAGVLVTPLLTPPLAAVLGLSLVAVLPGPAFCILDPVLAPALRASLQALRWLAETGARLVPPPLHPPPPPLPGLLLGLGVVVALAVLGRRRAASPLETLP